MGAGMGMRDVCAGIPWVFAGVGRRVLWVYDAIYFVVVVVGGELWGRREVRRERTGGRDLLRKRREREYNDRLHPCFSSYVVMHRPVSL